jgi:beta-1,4-mannosyl-glycoprotein beta-1,4-N-acetylglucosaminyltransferase
MLLDTFLYNGEYDLLEFRLRYLWDRVDRFVIVQADHTFSGKPNPFDNLERFSWAKEKILSYPINLQVSEDPWINERNQRNAIIDACTNYSNLDTIMMGDIDEIPSYEAVDFKKENNLMYPMTCDMRVIPYSLNYVREDIGWRGTIMCDLEYARQQTAQALRDRRERFSPFPNGGWHLTYFGGAERVKHKIESYSHQENNMPEFTNLGHIENCIKTGSSLFKDGDDAHIRKVSRTFYPGYLLKHAPDNWWLDDYVN